MEEQSIRVKGLLMVQEVPEVCYLLQGCPYFPEKNANDIAVTPFLGYQNNFMSLNGWF